MDAPCFRCGSRLTCRHRKASDAPLTVYADPEPSRNTFHTAFASATNRYSTDEILSRLAAQLRP